MNSSSDGGPRECSHRPPCPGCPRFGLTGIAPASRSELEAFCLAHGLGELQLSAGQAWGYRHRVRLAVRGRVDAPKIGLYRSNSHQVVAIPSCAIHAPPINQLVEVVRQAIRATRTPIYSEQARAGLVRYLQFVVERRSARVQLVVVGSAAEATSSAPLLDEIRRRGEQWLHSLVYNGQPERTNAILGPHWTHVWGPPAVVEDVLGTDVHYPPGAFGQANPDLFDRIVQRVHAWVAPSTRVVELFAGVGTIGLGLLARGERVVFNEVSTEGLRGLGMGLAALPESARARALLRPGPAEVVAASVGLRDAHLICDPPRRGLDPLLLAAICEQRPREISYVSCGLPSFLRDARALLHAGWRCEELAAYALFPFTEHVETVARFTRAEGR